MIEHSTDQARILIIDQGGHASRALLMDQNGQIHGHSEIAISATHNAEGHIEYMPEMMLASLRGAIGQTTENIDYRNIQAAAMATQRSNIICWDKNTGAALSPIISWQDRRAHQWLTTKQDQATSIHKQTGLFLSAHYGASKLRWCLDNIDAVQKASRQQTLAWGPMASWLTNQLCQESPFVCDAVNASRTLLWSLQQCDWSESLLELFELPATGLPPSVDNHFDFGNLAVNGHNIPLQLVTGDQAAALYAFGIPQTDTAYITAGTGAFILNPCGQQATINSQLLSSIVLLDKSGPHYAYEGTVNGAGSALDYYASHLNLPDYIDKLPEWLTLASQSQTPQPPLFLNGFSGLGTPFMQAQFASQFIGDGDEINRLVAVIESIVFLLQLNLDHMKQLNPLLQRIIIGGGLARFDGFCQCLADLGQPVIRPAETETTSRGLAFLTFQGLDQRQHLKDPALLENSDTFTPVDNPTLKQRYQQWQHAMEKQLQHD